jgi:hypothetical protein
MVEGEGLVTGRGELMVVSEVPELEMAGDRERLEGCERGGTGDG